ncbi:MAG: sigma-54-dependent transcriptional regulator [Acidobacteriota bacterium]
MSAASDAATQRDPIRILVVDDEPVVQDVLGRLLSRAGYEALFARTAEEGLALVDSDEPDLIILDVMLPDRDGLELLEAIKRLNGERPVIMMTAYGSVENAVAAMKHGAYHYLTKPFSNDEVILVIEKALDARRLREENRFLRSLLSGDETFESIVGKSRAMRDVFRLVDQVASSRSTVLILGESGTGKELVARAIHNRSPRKSEAFVSVNSGSIPPDLMESNLFGHVKGAFTGAVQAADGLFSAAGGGTLFFDEIGTVRLDLQAKLLRVIQERSFMPVGSTRSVTVDVRILAATNVDLRTLVERGEFREDLYYRLNVLRVEIPPLRERREDVQLLADHFMKKYALENDRTISGFEPEAMAALLDHPWPGNVRQLENAVTQGVVLSSGPRIALTDLPAEIREDRRPAVEPVLPHGISLSEALADTERRLIRGALRQSGGVQRRAAEALRIKPTTLNEKMKRLGLKGSP